MSTTPALSKALAWLRSRPPSSSYSSTTRLAYEAGVSYVTMWKALRVYEEKLPKKDNSPPQAIGKSRSDELQESTAQDRLASRIENVYSLVTFSAIPPCRN